MIIPDLVKHQERGLLETYLLGKIFVSTSASINWVQASKFVPSLVPCFNNLGASVSTTALKWLEGLNWSAGNGSVIAFFWNSVLPYAFEGIISKTKWARCCAIDAPRRIAASRIDSRSSTWRMSCSSGCGTAWSRGFKISSLNLSTVRLRRSTEMRLSRMRAVVLRHSWKAEIYSSLEFFSWG